MKLPKKLTLDEERIDLKALVNETMTLLTLFTPKKKRGDSHLGKILRELKLVADELNMEYEKPRPPIPMLLRCPACHHRHIDEGDFATAMRPHRVHACQFCGEHFQPSNEHTVGVQFLPGAKNE